MQSKSIPTFWGLYNANGIYWHSLDVIWIVLYATLWLGSR